MPLTIATDEEEPEGDRQQHAGVGAVDREDLAEGGADVELAVHAPYSTRATETLPVR